ncbi:hypothetical protein BD626DRAFT_491873 [Schizophyllum amplum]|uniref:NADAR domain-containing protein n=1 Tax=Schizophyllum amplum TaxID=97359 RepID=A0A550CI35_9AGAR|nr:hypothetical protein BD626DRAFT_491873 [Auriculariopsis ampla]
MPAPSRRQTAGSKSARSQHVPPGAGRSPAFAQTPQSGGRAPSNKTARPSPFRIFNPVYWCLPAKGNAPRTTAPTTRGLPTPRQHGGRSQAGKAAYPSAQQRILFYHKHDPHYGFTNFSDHPVTYEGKVYPTSEHLFQALKFLPHRPQIAEHIRRALPNPRSAFTEAHRFQKEERKDWKKVNVQMMDLVIEHKFTQHATLRGELLATGDAELVEDSAQDAFWGIGTSGKGRNELGKALMRLRTKLRNQRR